MDLNWIIFKHHIALKSNNLIFHPSAEEIMRIIEADSPIEIEGMKIPPLTKELQGIKYANVGLPIKCRIENSSDGKIKLNIYCLKFGEKVEVDIENGVLIDHCVCDDTWYYINGNVEGINRVFDDLKIKTITDISVRQYIGLLKCKNNIGDNTICNCLDVKKLNRILPSDIPMPSGLNANLYEYQKTGYVWMKYMLEQNHGCIIGDEMGLGKTIQVIALLQNLKNTNNLPALVIAPVSLLHNWKNECKKFAPQLNVCIHHGSNRTGFYKALLDYDVVVISYSTAISDSVLLSMIHWNLVVVDEAQNIKNPSSKRTRFIKKLPRNASIAITGTPFENHMTDIWSIIDFVVPGMLGTIEEFNKEYQDDVFGAMQVEPIISPMLLRRTVDEVAKDLPEKVIVSQPIDMSDEESLRYEDIRNDILNSEQNGILGIDSIQALRMYCTHPYVGSENIGSDIFDSSIKYQRLCEIIESVLRNDEKVIIFTSFNKMFDIMYEDMQHRFGITPMIINGSTPVDERQDIVDKFNNSVGGQIIILNPRAAGTGLNVTGANHVVHYNLEWNPALEDQCSARAYRRGQKKTVFIYRLFYSNTVEEIMNDRIERKRAMALNAVVGIDGAMENKEDIIRALTMSPLGKE